MRSVAFLLVLAALAAGCAEPSAAPTPPTTPTIDPATWQAIGALLADVPCEATVGDATSDNVVPLGALQLPEEQGDLGEADVRGDLMVAARHQLGGLHTIDMTDPRAPVILGTLELNETAGLDVKFIPGRDAAVIGAVKKLYLVDLSDLTAPTLLSEADVATQSHMVTPWMAPDGTVYVYVASQTHNQPAFVYKLDGNDLTLVGSFGSTGTPLAAGPLGNHDIAIYNDTMLNAPVLYLADGVLGWSAWTLDDPTAPTRIGGSVGHELGAGYVHTVRVGFFEGKRIVVTMQEVGQNTLKVYDATNLQAPLLLARWNADPTQPQTPQHNIQLLDTWLFMAHYTRGVYVFDLSDIAGSPPILGTATLAPAARFAVADPATPNALGFGNVWDVVVTRGVMWTTDLTGVLSTAAFACLPVGDAAASATL